MKLYLVQHADAEAKEADPQRPLSGRGLMNIRRVASFLARKETTKVSHILHSGKRRAEQTAEILAAELLPGSVTATDGLNPLDDPAIWTGRLAETNEDLMLVGHLPHLGKLAAQLVTGDAEQQPITFRMGGAFCLARDDDGNWSVCWGIVPDLFD
jgi:phosphohistidine phosphatase